MSASSRTLALCVMACFGAHPAIAAENTFAPYLGYTYGIDDNVFGLANDNQYLLLTGRGDGSDTTRTARAGVRAVYQISRQLFDLNAELSHTRYTHFNLLDYNGRSVAVNWHWVVGNTWSGTIGTTNVQSASQLSNFQQITRNLRTDSQTYASANWMVTPSWRAILDRSKLTLRYDLSSQQFANIDQNKLAAGLSYVAASGSTIGLLLQQLDGKYPGRRRFTGQNEDFQQHEVDISIDAFASGKSKVQFLAGWTARDSASTARNFSGPTARATWNWALTGKTILVTSLWKEVAAVDDVLASYSVNRGAALTPSWSVSDKVTVQGDLRYEKRKFQDTAVAMDDTDRTASMIIVYRPFRHVSFHLSDYFFSRQGNAYGGGYRRRGAALSAKYTF